MKDKLKWLLAGPGNIAHTRVAPALMNAQRSELVAICGSKRPEKTLDLARKCHVDVTFDDFDEALEKCDADAVYIATPHHLHVEMLKKTIAAGKHVFCEKPLGINAAECREAALAVRNAPKIRAGCSNYRLFTNQFRTTEKVLRSGEVGDLLGAWLHDEEGFYNPNCLKKSLGGNPEHSYGFYLFNMVQKLFGYPESVFCAASGFNCAGFPDFDLEDLQNIVLRFPGGRQVSILLNFTAQKVPLRHAYSFICSRGRIYWPECPPHFDSAIEVIRTYSRTPLPESVSGTDGVMPNWHLPMVQDFVDAVLDGREPFCTVESAAETAVITEAVERSAVSGKSEPVPPLF